MFTERWPQFAYRKAKGEANSYSGIRRIKILMHHEKKALLYGNAIMVSTKLMVMTANTIVVSRNTVSNGNFESTNGFSTRLVICP